MTIPYCLPIIKPTKEEVLDVISAQEKSYQFIEVWIDYISDFDEQFVKNLIEKLGEKVIIVMRRQKLEPIKMSFEKRCAVIKLLEGSNVLLDVDVSVQPEELDFISKNTLSVKMITSYHNYDETPKDARLMEIITSMEKYNPAIFKFSTFCSSDSDALRLLQLLLQLQEKRVQYIVLGMGEKGMITRIFGTLWGNTMIFAPLTISEQSAPGQLTKQQLETIFASMKGEPYGRE